VALLLDAGALTAYDRRNEFVVALIESAQRKGVVLRTSTAVVAQVWRDGARQARLARLLAGVDEFELTKKASRAIGLLLASSGTSDVVDAGLVEFALDGDEIVTTDPADIAHLAEASDKKLFIVAVSA
jgi:hypothetical protein